MARSHFHPPCRIEACYIVDCDGESRHFGSLRDWWRVFDFMSVGGKNCIKYFFERSPSHVFPSQAMSPFFLARWRLPKSCNISSWYRSWHHEAFVIINLVEKKTFLLSHAQKLTTLNVKEGLNYLRSSSTSLGFIVHGDDQPRFAFVEASSSCQDIQNFKRFLARDKLTMAILRVNKHVEHWWD